MRTTLSQIHLRTQRLVRVVLIGLSVGACAAAEPQDSTEKKARFFYNDDGDRALSLSVGSYRPQQILNAVSSWTVTLNGQALPDEPTAPDAQSLVFALNEVLPTVGWNTISVTPGRLADPQSDIQPSLIRLELTVECDILGVSWDH